MSSAFLKTWQTFLGRRFGVNYPYHYSTIISMLSEETSAKKVVTIPEVSQTRVSISHGNLYLVLVSNIFFPGSWEAERCGGDRGLRLVQWSRDRDSHRHHLRIGRPRTERGGSPETLQNQRLINWP